MSCLLHPVDDNHDDGTPKRVNNPSYYRLKNHS